MTLAYAAGVAQESGRFSTATIRNMKLYLPAEYQSQAQAQFDALAEELALVFPAARLEHVGASAIPGAISKGDLDLALLVEPGAHGAAVARLQALGWRIKGDTLRTEALCMLIRPEAGAMDIAIQVVALGSEFEFFLRFRDALRADTGLVEQYNQIKRDFADAGEGAYRAAKSRFIEQVLAR